MTCAMCQQERLTLSAPAVNIEPYAAIYILLPAKLFKVLQIKFTVPVASLKQTKSYHCVSATQHATKMHRSRARRQVVAEVAQLASSAAEGLLSFWHVCAAHHALSR